MTVLPAAISMLAVSILLLTGCGVKMSQIPIVSYPYISEFEILKDVRNVEGKARKTKFKNGQVFSPFHFFVKVSEIENNGVVRVVFYEGNNKKLKEYEFSYGEEGKYYEYIMFFDRVDGFGEGKYRYAVYNNSKLLFEGSFEVHKHKGDTPGK